MKTHIISLSICILCTLFLVGCQSTNSANKDIPPKVVAPQAPFLDENIEVIQERTDANVDRTANVAGHTAHTPVRFWNRFVDSFRGVSHKNPYDRAEPYYRDEYKKDVLASAKKDITQPLYMRGERYSKAYRSPFIFREELQRGGTSEMTTISEVESSLLAKQYLDFQKDLEDDLDRAEKYYAEEKYSEALEIVDKVMDLDSSSRRGRVLFEKIIQAREKSKIEHETEMRERVRKHEKISQYLQEAKSFLEQNNYDEALRIANKAVSVDATHEGARELLGTIELAKFENNLKMSGTSSMEILERMIYKHLMLYQQYSKEELIDLAKKELQKVSVLESYRDKVSGLSE